MTTVILAAATLVLQRVLTHPGLPSLAGAIWVPLVWLVWAPLKEERRWPLWALVTLGLAWDVVMEPVIGPGGISWSAAGLTVAWIAARIADRSPAAWAGAGALAGGLVLLIRQLCFLPLGLKLAPAWPGAVKVVLLAALWCGAVGTVAGIDAPGAWRRFRRRRLR